MLPKMSEEKATTEPTIIFSQNAVSPPDVSSKARSYRKYIITGVIGIVVAAIVLTAILVGMHLFTQAQKDILKFSYTRDGNVKEEVTSNPNSNIVQYHATAPGYEMWIVDDFNRDIQVTKITGESGTNCYVAPLNRTLANDPSKVNIPSNIKKQNASFTVTYRISNSPIPDTSFLSKAAKDTCQGISNYWVYPHARPQIIHRNCLQDRNVVNASAGKYVFGLYLTQDVGGVNLPEWKNANLEKLL